MVTCRDGGTRVVDGAEDAVSYVELAEAGVPRGTIAAASFTLEKACATLAVPRPRIRWFIAGADSDPRRVPWGGEDRDLAGLTDPFRRHELWLRATLPRAVAVVTVIHETIHLRQFWSRTHEVWAVDDLEAQASRYAEPLAKAWGLL